MYTQEDREAQINDIRERAGIKEGMLQSPIAVIYNHGVDNGRYMGIIPKGAAVYCCCAGAYTPEDNGPGIYFALSSDRRVEIFGKNGSETGEKIITPEKRKQVLTALNPKNSVLVGAEEINVALNENGIEKTLEDLLR